jgi:hypothetical protein
MAEENLVILSKFDRRDIAEPTEQYIFCLENYETRKEQFKGYEITKVHSSMPKIWCEVCTPPQWS